MPDGQIDLTRPSLAARLYIRAMYRCMQREQVLAYVAEAFAQQCEFTGYAEVYELCPGEIATAYSPQNVRFIVETGEFCVRRDLSADIKGEEFAELIYRAWDELQVAIGNQGKRLAVRSKPTIVFEITEFVLWCEVGFIDADCRFSGIELNVPFMRWTGVSFNDSVKTQDWLVRWKR